MGSSLRCRFKLSLSLTVRQLGKIVYKIVKTANFPVQLKTRGIRIRKLWLCDRSLEFCKMYYGLHRKWNESGFRPPLCTYRLNWARRTSWGWWDDWDDTVLQTQDSKFEPWRSEAEHATSRSRRLPTILTFTRGWGRNNFVSFKPPRPGTEPRTLAWKADYIGYGTIWMASCTSGLIHIKRTMKIYVFDSNNLINIRVSHSGLDHLVTDFF